jgi:hypothetical protein
VVGIVCESVLLWAGTPRWRAGVLLIGVLGALQAFELGRFRQLALGLGLAAFCVVAADYIRIVAKAPRIDVFVMQQMAAEALVRGVNPYAAIYPNIYGANTPFYDPRVVDASNHLTVGFPYPPLSLLLILPGYLLGGDCRYVDIAAVAGAAWLMAAVSRSKWSGAVAFLFLLTPRVLHVIENSWTEPLFVFAFSLVMFCAMRWRRALPYALGVFLATKQYAVFSLPLVVLLLKPSEGWKDGVRLVGTAMIVAALVTIPFWLWDPAAFWRSVVWFRFMQPRSMDALSHLTWMHARLPWIPFLSAVPIAALVTTTALALRHMTRSPAQFAGAVTLVHLALFAFSERAFANYYYFTIATAAWAAAAAGSQPLSGDDETNRLRSDRILQERRGDDE